MVTGATELYQSQHKPSWTGMYRPISTAERVYIRWTATGFCGNPHAIFQRSVRGCRAHYRLNGARRSTQSHTALARCSTCWMPPP